MVSLADYVTYSKLLCAIVPRLYLLLRDYTNFIFKGPRHTYSLVGDRDAYEGHSELLP